MLFATLATLATPVITKRKLGVARFFSTLPPFATPKITLTLVTFFAKKKNGVPVSHRPPPPARTTETSSPASLRSP